MKSVYVGAAAAAAAIVCLLLLRQPPVTTALVLGRLRGDIKASIMNERGQPPHTEISRTQYRKLRQVAEDVSWRLNFGAPFYTPQNVQLRFLVAIWDVKRGVVVSTRVSCDVAAPSDACASEPNGISGVEGQPIVLPDDISHLCDAIDFAVFWWPAAHSPLLGVLAGVRIDVTAAIAACEAISHRKPWVQPEDKLSAIKCINKRLERADYGTNLALLPGFLLISEDGQASTFVAPVGMPMVLPIVMRTCRQVYDIEGNPMPVSCAHIPRIEGWHLILVL